MYSPAPKLFYTTENYKIIITNYQINGCYKALYLMVNYCNKIIPSLYYKICETITKPVFGEYVHK